MRVPSWWLRLLARWAKPRQVEFVSGDELPAVLPKRDLIVAREGEDDWSVGMRCPCGCGARLELALLPNVKPRWDLTLDENGRPSLSPSVWLREGCRSHFWLRHGRLIWC